MSVNLVSLSGNIVKDATLSKTSGNGTSVLNFTMAVNDRRRNNKTGEWEEHPNFIDISVFGKRAATIADRCKKGVKVAVQGSLRQNTWIDKVTGQSRSRITVICDEIDFMQRVVAADEGLPEEPELEVASEPEVAEEVFAPEVAAPEVAEVAPVEEIAPEPDPEPVAPAFEPVPVSRFEFAEVAAAPEPEPAVAPVIAPVPAAPEYDLKLTPETEPAFSFEPEPAAEPEPVPVPDFGPAIVTDSNAAPEPEPEPEHHEEPSSFLTWDFGPEFEFDPQAFGIAPEPETAPEPEPAAAPAPEPAPVPEPAPQPAPAPAPQQTLTCPHCGAEYESWQTFCMNCGASLKKEEPAPEPAKPAENKCPACGAINREGAHFCMQCGKKLQ